MSDGLARLSRFRSFSEGSRGLHRCHDAGIHVPDAVFDALRLHFSQREIVELTVTIGSYNLVSRFLEALAVDPGPART